MQRCAARLVLHEQKFRPYHCWRLGLFTLAATSAAGQFTDLQVSPSSSSIVSGWDVRSRLSSQRPMSPPLCYTRRPGSFTSQIGKIRKKFLCLWSAAVELTTTDCPWRIIDTDSVLRMIADFSVFQSLRDIIIAPLWQFQLYSLFAWTQIYLLTNFW